MGYCPPNELGELRFIKQNTLLPCQIALIIVIKTGDHVKVYAAEGIVEKCANDGDAK